MRKVLGLRDVVLMSVLAVTNLRWAAWAAAAGPSSIGLWALAAVLFFLPEAAAVAELSARYPDEGGLYRWTRRAFGPAHGFLCGWAYWVSNLVYFPSLLLYVSANIALALPGDRSGSGGFVLALTLGSLWFIALLCVRGLSASRWLQTGGALGNWVPAVAAVALGAVCLWRFGPANPLTLSSMSPDFKDPGHIGAFSQLCFALAGLELVTFMSGEIKDSGRTLTRSILISAALIAAAYVASTVGLLAAVPHERISSLNGILLPIREAGARLDAPWVGRLCAPLIALAGLAGTWVWFAGSARIPYVAGVDQYLPPALGRLHPRYGTPYVSILTQAVLATVFTVFAAGRAGSMEAVYKILVDMTLLIYFVPFCYLFLALLKLKKEDEGGAGFRIPGGRAGTAAAALTGLATTVAAMLVTVFPAGQGWDWTVPVKSILGALALLAAGVAFYARGGGKAAAPAAA